MLHVRVLADLLPVLRPGAGVGRRRLALRPVVHRPGADMGVDDVLHVLWDREGPCVASAGRHIPAALAPAVASHAPCTAVPGRRAGGRPPRTRMTSQGFV